MLDDQQGHSALGNRPAEDANYVINHLHPKAVLIIDDDPVFTLLASETLQQAGFDARIATNTRDALAAFEKEKPDLVLLDVELPGSNGFDICGASFS